MTFFYTSFYSYIFKYISPKLVYLISFMQVLRLFFDQTWVTLVTVSELTRQSTSLYISSPLQQPSNNPPFFVKLRIQGKKQQLDFSSKNQFFYMSVPSHWFNITKSADPTPQRTSEGKNAELAREGASQKKAWQNFLVTTTHKKYADHTTSHSEMCLEGNVGEGEPN